MNFEKEDMINIFYQSQEKKIAKIIKKIDENIKEKLTKINIEKIIEESNCTEQLKEIFNIIEDNYNIKITEYSKGMYKQGFIDGVNLILNCLKE